MIKPVLSFIASLIILAGSITYLVWWQLAHNFTNNACSNVIYSAHHLPQCVIWNRASGIVAGITMPLIIVGLFGALGSGFWFFVVREDDR